MGQRSMHPGDSAHVPSYLPSEFPAAHCPPHPQCSTQSPHLHPTARLLSTPGGNPIAAGEDLHSATALHPRRGPECKPRQGRVIHMSGSIPPHSGLVSPRESSTGDPAGTPPPPPIHILSTSHHRDCNLLGAVHPLWVGAVGP